MFITADWYIDARCISPVWLTRRARLWRFVQKRTERGKQRVGNNRRTLRGGMDAIVLDRPRHAHQVYVEHRHKRHMMPRHQIVKYLVEGTDVIGPVIGRQRDARQQDLYVSFFKRREQLVEIAARLPDG